MSDIKTFGDFEYIIDEKGCAVIVKYNGNDSEVTIPLSINGFSVTSIGPKSFKNNSKITCVKIPEGVVIIDAEAFFNCKNLVSIVIPESVTEIGSEAFSYCSNLASLVIPDNVSSIGDSAFGHCTKLEQVIIPDKVSHIGNKTFFNCLKLRSIKIPDSVTSIGSEAFINCSDMEDIIIPNSVTSIGKRAFESCKKLKNIIIPYGITYIEDSTFSYCEALKSITLPESLIGIGGWAFESCSRLSSIVIPESVTSIEKLAFSCCRGLTSIIIPKNVTNIGDGAFKCCSSLKSVIFLNGMSVNENVFSNCYQLDGKIRHHLHKDVFKDVSGNGSAFEVSGEFKEFFDETEFDMISKGNNNNTMIFVKKGYNKLKITYSGGEEKSVEVLNEIEENAFRGNSNIRSVVIPKSVNVISTAAFRECKNLESVVIKGKVTLEMFAFADCKKLKSVTFLELPAVSEYGGISDDDVKGSVFAGCENLKEKNLDLTSRSSAASIKYRMLAKKQLTNIEKWEANLHKQTEEFAYQAREDAMARDNLNLWSGGHL